MESAMKVGAIPCAAIPSAVSTPPNDHIIRLVLHILTSPIHTCHYQHSGHVPGVAPGNVCVETISHHYTPPQVQALLLYHLNSTG